MAPSPLPGKSAAPGNIRVMMLWSLWRQDDLDATQSNSAAVPCSTALQSFLLYSVLFIVLHSWMAWWAWGRTAALSHSPESALLPGQAAFDSVYRTLIRNLTLFSPHSQRVTRTKLFLRGEGRNTTQKAKATARARCNKVLTSLPGPRMHCTIQVCDCTLLTL